MKNFFENNWLYIMITLFFITFIILAYLFGIQPQDEIIITKDPAWLEWERAYGRQGF